MVGLPPRSLVAYVGGPLGVAQVLSLAALPHITGWYQRLRKPRWTPPVWLFGPAWTVMYTAQSYAGWLVLHQAKARGRPAWLWGTQLALNFAWQPLFFNGHKLQTALADIVALDVAIALTAWEFSKVNRKAAILMLPYLAWTTYATALNYNIMKNNPPKGANTPEERHELEVEAAKKVDAGKVEPGVSYAAKAKGT
jgi:tryptophan-rich sensory protein